MENIGEYAFYCCHGLKDVELEKITYLSQYAFYSCEGLESVSLPKVEYIGKNAFKGCYKLRYISFPVVERIDSYAFSNCVNILQFILPSSLTTIDTNAFYECRPVEVVNYTSFSIYRLNSGNGYVGYNAYSIIKDIANSVIETEGNFITFTFSNKKYVAGLVDRTVKKVVIPNTIDEIKMAAFYGDQIEELEISNFNRVLAYYFYGNSYYYNSSYLPESLTKVVIGSDTTSLAKNCFTNCKYIKEIYYNGTIEDWCKMDFSSREYNPLCCGIDNIYFKVGNEYKILDTIEIPESITEIGNYQFAGFKIKKVIIPSSVTYIGSYAFYNCRNLTDIVMGSQVNEIGEYAFSNTLLKSVTLPNSVTIISNGLFENCSNLLVVRLGNNVTTINNKAFKNCRLLFDIIIPSSVNTLGDSVFMGCEQIESFNLKDTGITALTSYLFANCINLTEIEFPTELDSIESTTFDKCDKLQLTAYKNGYYYGTPENEYRWLIKARTSQIFDCTVHPKCEKVYPGAFSSCKNLKRIIIPSTCTDFAGCLKGLTNVEYIECPLYGTNNFAKTLFDLTSNADVPSKLKTVVINGATSNTLQSSAFKGCLYIQTVTITGSITKINDYAFENCSGLEAINIESALTTLGIAVFRSSGLKVFIAPSTLRNTGNCLFEKCTSLVTADFSAVTYEFQKNNTGTYLFSECTALSNVVLHSSFDYITDHAFYKCKALKTLTFPTYLDDIDEYAFAESGLESANFRWIYKIGRNAFEKTKLTSVSLPEVNTLGVCAFANCTNLTTVKFNYNGENNTTLYTINANVFEGCSLLSTLELPTNLQTIDNSAFKGCSSLTSVGLPSTLTKIYSNAFENCGLTSFITDKAITFGEKVFYNCKDLETVSITNGDAGFFFPSTTYTSAIYADYMFAGCSSLTSVTMPDTMATIRPYMFKDCTSLATYDFTNVKTIGYNAFENTGFVSLSLHSTLTAGQNAFKGCEKLETVVVNKVLANSGVFENCTALKSATLSEDTVEIVSSTFRGCTSLESFTFGDNVTTIDSYAFYESGIKTLDIQANIKEIGERAFFGCKIEELIIPSTASSVGSYAFAENKSLKKATLYLDYGNSSILYKCSALEEVVLAEGIKAIPSWMFGCCTSLESITFPSTLTTIGYASFYECTSLASITIPKNVTSIEGYAFNDCTSLKDVYNYSSLALVLNSTDNGYVAYYADAIHTSQINEEDVVTDANGYKFSKINDKYYLVGYTGESQMLVLPETFEYNENTINEYEIYPNAFFNNKQIRSITIKGNVTAIGEYAFGGCSNLLEVYNLSGLDLAIGSISNGYIAYYALQIHTSIDEESIYVEESNFIFMCYEEDGVNKGVVVGYNGTSIDITIPSSFTYNGTLIENISINAQAFEGCNFTSVTLSNGIIKIGSYAFRDCTSLTSIVVPSSVASCDVNPFTGCTSITKANIPSFMIKYVNRYDAGMSTLKEIVVNSGDKIDDYALSNLSITKVELADTITTIGANAFYRSDDFEEIVLPSGLTTLGASAFEQCGLKRVTIPETLTNIPAKAFYYNNGLRVVVLTNKNVVIYSNAFQKSNGTSTITRVYCKGTESDFANISIWLYTMNSKVYGTKYYYTEETPTTPGNYWHYDTDGRAVEYQYETAESLYHEMIEKMKEYLMNAATNSEYVYIGDDASLNIRQVDVDMFNMTYDAFINILTLENETDLLNRINSLVTSCNLKLGIEGTDRYYLATSSNSATINSYILKVDDKLKITCTQI